MTEVLLQRRRNFAKRCSHAIQKPRADHHSMFACDSRPSHERRFRVCDTAPVGTPIPFTEYGPVMISVNGSAPVGGRITLQITGDQNAVFFLTRLILIIGPAEASNLVLDSLNIDGTGTIAFSSYGVSSPKIVVVPAGSTSGESISALPSYADSFLLKDLAGNMGLAINGADSGATFVFHFDTQTFAPTIVTIALVTAPSSDSITIAMS